MPQTDKVLGAGTATHGRSRPSSRQAKLLMTEADCTFQMKPTRGSLTQWAYMMMGGRPLIGCVMVRSGEKRLLTAHYTQFRLRFASLFLRMHVVAFCR